MEEERGRRLSSFGGRGRFRRSCTTGMVEEHRELVQAHENSWTSEGVTRVFTDRVGSISKGNVIMFNLINFVISSKKKITLLFQRLIIFFKFKLESFRSNL